jgi:hypothetical protein
MTGLRPAGVADLPIVLALPRRWRARAWPGQVLAERLG